MLAIIDMHGNRQNNILNKNIKVSGNELKDAFLIVFATFVINSASFESTSTGVYKVPLIKPAVYWNTTI